MNIKHILFAATASIALSAPAFADDTYQTTTKVQKDSSGNYDETNTTTRTDAAGNTTTYQKNAKVGVDAMGNTSKNTTTTKVTDGVATPPHVVHTSNTEQVKDGVVTTSQAVAVDGKVIDAKTETKTQ